MAKSPLENPIFQDKTKARIWLENLLWADSRPCGYCGVVDENTPISSRPGYYQCNACRKQFTVTVGTVFERSHIPLNKWLMAAFLLCASKKGISAHQMHRMLGITYKSAWFMCHRLREAMKPGKTTPFGSGGGAVEVDETYFGRKAGMNIQPGGTHKHTIVALVERDGRARSFYVPKLGADDMRDVLFHHISRDAHLKTDESSRYNQPGKEFASHETVNHSQDEYVRGTASTNTVEGVFSIFKRGMIGTYQHCGEQHLQRYLAEFDFRYSNRAALEISDTIRAEKALKGIQGKRLTYRRINEAAHH
jgi:transposase-like protein